MENPLNVAPPLGAGAVVVEDVDKAEVGEDVAVAVPVGVGGEGEGKASEDDGGEDEEDEGEEVGRDGAPSAARGRGGRCTT